MAKHGMTDRRLAELAGHRDMLRMIKVLTSEEHDLPFQEGVAHLLLSGACANLHDRGHPSSCRIG